MGVYTAQITNLVNIQYADTAGAYNAAQRAAIIAWLDLRIVTLVIPSAFPDQRIEAIKAQIAVSAYANMVGSELTKLLKNCETVLDFAIGANTIAVLDSAYPANALIWEGWIEQNGVNPPTLTELVNNFPDPMVPVYNAVGSYSITNVGNPFVNGNVFFTIGQASNAAVLLALAYVYEIMANELGIITLLYRADTITGAMLTTPSDDCLYPPTYLKILVIP